jgi:nitrogen fixation protein FixH
MKINWGTGIAIFYSSFVLIMILMVVKASRTEINMVQENYYDQDLNYEAFRKSRQNGQSDLASIEYISGAQEVIILFDETSKSVTGNIKLYRPSDNLQDKNLTIKADQNNKVIVPVSELSRGYWKIQVQWESDGRQYYKEQAFIL